MTEPITVSGGSDSIAATTEELRALASVVLGARDTIADIVGMLDSGSLYVAIAGASDADPVAAAELELRLRALVQGPGELFAANRATQQLYTALDSAATRYDNTDLELFFSFLAALGHLFVALSDTGRGNMHGAEDHFYDALPGLTPLAMTELRLWGVTPDPVTIADGHAVLHPLGADTSTMSLTPPRTVGDLMRALAVRDGGRAGEISVSIVTEADGRQAAIVDIPGTKSWTLAPTADVTSVGTDLRAMAGLDTSYEDGVLAALRAADVGPATDVMLVGHSEGGIIAVNTARDARRTGEFRITHVITAGAPIGDVLGRLPGSVQVLALENERDVVPATDSAENPDEPNITTVTVDDQHDSIVGNHSLDDTYIPEADAVDASDNGSIEQFRHSASRFLNGESVLTHGYLITRGY
jgi:pimeloyl-ACP methyl ester carboxylesterase